MHRLTTVSLIKNNFYSTLKQQPVSVSSYKVADIPSCNQIFLMNWKTVKTHKTVNLYLKTFFIKKVVSS